ARPERKQFGAEGRRRIDAVVIDVEFAVALRVQVEVNGSGAGWPRIVERAAGEGGDACQLRAMRAVGEEAALGIDQVQVKCDTAAAAGCAEAGRATAVSGDAARSDES